MSLKNFQTLSELGTGSFASVYKVRRHEDHQIYALKKVKLLTLSDKEKENALNEIRILASVKNPFIISYKQSFLDEETSTLCLVTQFADDGDLEAKISKSKNINESLSESQIWSIFIQMAKALKFLHAINIAHRDLKSANVFLFKNGKVKIGDMNVSKIIKNNLCVTQTGTPYYASPQVWKDVPYNTKSDIWSLGCLVYEIANLHPPFMAENMEGLYKRVLKGIYPKIQSKYSKSLRNLIRMMLQVDPENRADINSLLSYAEGAIMKSQVLKTQDDNEMVIVSQKNIDQIKMHSKQKKSKENEQDQTISLLCTIKLPRKMSGLIDRLPKSNYQEKGCTIIGIRDKLSTGNLPSINRAGLTRPPLPPMERIKKFSIKKVRSEKLLPLPTVSTRIIIA